MEKFLMKFWQGSPNFKLAKEIGNGKYLTLKLSLNSDENTASEEANFCENGSLFVRCDKYEIVSSDTGDNWNEFVKLDLEERYLRITPLDIVIGDTVIGNQIILFGLPVLVGE